jgi:hypothetical protein
MVTKITKRTPATIRMVVGFIENFSLGLCEKGLCEKELCENVFLKPTY